MAYLVKPSRAYQRPIEGPAPVKPDTSMTGAQTLTLAGKSAEKVLGTINTGHEADLINKGYLEKAKFKVFDPKGTGELTADNQAIDIFQRKGGDRGFFKDIYKNKLRKWNERIEISPEGKDWLLKQKDPGASLHELIGKDMTSQEMTPFFEDLGVDFDFESVAESAYTELPVEAAYDLPGGDFIPEVDPLAHTAIEDPYFGALKEGALDPNLPVGGQPIASTEFVDPSQGVGQGFGQGAFGQGLKNMFVPQQGVAQGMPMQVAKAGMNIGKGGLQGLFAPKIAAQKAVEATLSAGGTQAAAQAAGQAAANQGLMAGMGPLGWSMMALQMLQMFPEHTVLGKVGKKIKKMFSDERLKDNIITVGKSKSGIPVKEFGYRGLKGRYRGVVSKDVPWATSKDNASGYDMVDYSKIDVSFEKIQ